MIDPGNVFKVLLASHLQNRQKFEVHYVTITMQVTTCLTNYILITNLVH